MRDIWRWCWLYEDRHDDTIEFPSAFYRIESKCNDSNADSWTHESHRWWRGHIQLCSELLRRSLQSFLPRGSITQDKRDNGVLHEDDQASHRQADPGRRQSQGLRLEATNRQQAYRAVSQRVLWLDIDKSGCLSSERWLHHGAENNHRGHHDLLRNRNHLQDVQAWTAKLIDKVGRLARKTRSGKRTHSGQLIVLANHWAVWLVLWTWNCCFCCWCCFRNLGRKKYKFRCLSW